MDNAPLHQRSTLIAAGFTEYELRSGLRAGELSRIRRGTYLSGRQPEEAPQRHELAVRAAFPELADGTVVSHGSAAVLHGLPTWSVPLQRVQVTRVMANGGRRRDHLHRRVARLDPDEVEHRAGIPVTTVARTVVDLARTLPFEPAVVIGDAALAAGLTDLVELAGMVRRSAHRPGCARARRAVSFLDGQAESVGESRSRVAIAHAGLPAPQLQWTVSDLDGSLIGRGDFGWPEHKVIGEFDGRIKYGRLLKPGEEPGEVVYREKLREDALRSLGYTVVRWTWQDLVAFGAIARRLHRLLA